MSLSLEKEYLNSSDIKGEKYGRVKKHYCEISLFWSILAGCQGELDTEHSYVEFGSTEDKDDRRLYFRVFQYWRGILFSLATR